MKLLFLSLASALLTCILIQAVPDLVDDEANDEMSAESSGEIPTPDDHVGMKTDANMELMREKLKKLNNAAAERIEKQAMHAPMEAAPVRTSEHFNRTLPVFPPVEKINQRIADYLYQGDILLTLEQVEALLSRNSEDDDDDGDESSSSESLSPDSAIIQNRRKKRKVASRRQLKWPTTKPISYYLSADLTREKIQVIAAAINFWQSHTCLTFQRVEELKHDEDVIRFFADDGCYSKVGRIGGNQPLSLADGCEKFGTVTHEIGHALGFWHEQARFDRDEFVKINMENIKKDKKGNFDKQTKESIETYSVPYEYGSIMHYGSNDFANDSSTNVLVAINPLYQQTMGQNIAPSFYDVFLANRHYNCFDKCSAATTICQNGGYPNPKNCSRCNCPSGFGGDLCDDQQRTGDSRCGQRLTATESWSVLQATVGENVEWQPSVSIKTVWEPVVCSWHLKAPIGRTIEMRIIEINALGYTGCTSNALQIKTSANYKMTGIRVCNTRDNENHLYKSESNLMPIIAEAYYRMAFKLQYRLVSTNTETSKEDETSTLEPYQETECQEAGGICKYSSECSSDRRSAALCPSQLGNVECCLPTKTSIAVQSYSSTTTRSRPYQEQKCRDALGECMYKSDCTGAHSISFMCPTQSADIECCIQNAVYQENECRVAGGDCDIKLKYRECTNGRWIKSLCPNQLSNVECCINNMNVYQEKKCKDAGGVCQSTLATCNGNRQTTLCPSQSAYAICCIPSFQEEQCGAALGQCKHQSECLFGESVSHLCPMQTADVKCCIPNKPYPEPECTAAGGFCDIKLKYSGCANGRWVASLCPKQPSNIECCINHMNVYQEKKCEDAGGVCQSSHTTCKGSSQENLCPSQSANAICCIPSFQEEQCKAALGQCKHKSECLFGESVSHLCPTQSADVQCCISNRPYAEPECTAAGGVCDIKLKYRECTNGRWIHSLCPQQLTNIACCINHMSVYQEKMCKDAGGVCQSSLTSCKGNSKTSLCPSQSADVVCCFPAFQEEQCGAALGQCKHKSECLYGESISRLCPTQSVDIECCIPNRPYQEPQCEAAGGECDIKLKYSGCANGGQWIASLCPLQPANIECCVRAGPYQEQKCRDSGGVCTYNTNCAGGIRVASFCPTQPLNIECCIMNYMVIHA